MELPGLLRSTYNCLLLSLSFLLDSASVGGDYSLPSLLLPVGQAPLLEPRVTTHIQGSGIHAIGAGEVCRLPEASWVETLPSCYNLELAVTVMEMGGGWKH